MNKLEKRHQRKLRVRAAAPRSDRPRLTVFRSNRHIAAQVIDDKACHTLAAASSLDESLRGKKKIGADKEAAKKVGKLLAERALAAGVTKVRFDRGGYIFHGRVSALAEAAREAGLDF
jgi:large subunit ribosomal protein L18